MPPVRPRKLSRGHAWRSQCDPQMTEAYGSDFDTKADREQIKTNACDNALTRAERAFLATSVRSAHKDTG
jgi:hypothetical protein